jgi:hypothetical protein
MKITRTVTPALPSPSPRMAPLSPDEQYASMSHWQFGLLQVCRMNKNLSGHLENRFTYRSLVIRPERKGDRLVIRVRRDTSDVHASPSRNQRDLNSKTILGTLVSCISLLPSGNVTTAYLAVLTTAPGLQINNRAPQVTRGVVPSSNVDGPLIDHQLFVCMDATVRRAYILERRLRRRAIHRRRPVPTLVNDGDRVVGGDSRDEGPECEDDGGEANHGAWQGRRGLERRG